MNVAVYKSTVFLYPLVGLVYCKSFNKGVFLCLNNEKTNIVEYEKINF